MQDGRGQNSASDTVRLYLFEVIIEHVKLSFSVDTKSVNITRR